MYALHEAGLAISALPPPQPTFGNTDQLEPRAVEATEHGSLATENRHAFVFSSTAAVLQLLEGSTRDYAELMAVVSGDGNGQAGFKLDAEAGQEVDVYA
ncbi:MAG: hypothetical protein ACE5I3_15805 [Phycisphaerae bacterium]